MNQNTIISSEVAIIDYRPIGSLVVFALQTYEEMMRNAPYREIYWKDAASPQGYGPFVSITAAFNHYKWIIQTCNRSSIAQDNKPSVIRVDFKSKKRVPHEA